MKRYKGDKKFVNIILGFTWFFLVYAIISTIYSYISIFHLYNLTFSYETFVLLRFYAWRFIFDSNPVDCLVYLSCIGSYICFIIFDMIYQWKS